MSALPNVLLQSDPDTIETQEWLDALEAVMTAEGPERAHFLLERMIEDARLRGLNLPFSADHPVHQHHSGRAAGAHTRRTRKSRHAIRDYTRWNAMAMVLRANEETNVGGHISLATPRRPRCTTSATTISGMRRPTTHGGDLIFAQGHSVPGIYARAFLLGRLTEEQLNNFRQEVDGKGISSYPAPVADAGFLAVPHRVDGSGPADGDLPGALHEVPAGPRSGADRRPQGVGLSRRRRDRRSRIAGRDRRRRPREARQPGVRHQLQPAASRRPGARQWQDHPGAGKRVPRLRLERHQAGLGHATGIRCSRATRTAS